MFGFVIGLGVYQINEESMLSVIISCITWTIPFIVSNKQISLITCITWTIPFIVSNKQISL